MTDPDSKRWRTPSLDRLGDELRKLEEAENRLPDRRRPLSHWRAKVVGSWAAIAAIVGTGITLALTGGAALARSPVNRAPAAAERSRSVQFTTIVSVEGSGAANGTLREHGAIDFVRHALESTATSNTGQAAIRRLSVNGVFYAMASGSAAGAPRSNWIALRAPRTGAGAAEALGSEALTDPPSLLAALAATRAHVVDLGPTTLDRQQVAQYRLRSKVMSLYPDIKRSEFSSVGAVPVTLNVWLDNAGRPVQVQERFAPRADATLQVVTRFSSYGTPVVIAAPTQNVVPAPAGSPLPDPVAADLAALLPTVGAHRHVVAPALSAHP